LQQRIIPAGTSGTASRGNVRNKAGRNPVFVQLPMKLEAPTFRNGVVHLKGEEMEEVLIDEIEIILKRRRNGRSID